MPTEARKSEIAVNPAMLRWARDEAGVSRADAAKRVKVKEERIAEWERDSPGEFPTVRQARELAEYYDVPFLEFFRPVPPVLPTPQLIPDYRLYATSDDPSSTRELRDIQLWAEVQRINVLDLYEEVGEVPPAINESLFTTVAASPEEAAERARAGIKFPIEEQIARNTEGRRQIPVELRRRIESLGILTLRRTDLEKLRVRGFCVAIFPIPIIVFASEAPTAQAFTLAHELAHVVIRQSAISGPMPRKGGDHEKRKVEEWCNRFASSFLMPRQAVAAYLDLPSRPLNSISDEVLHAAALHFGVSDHAMLVRFVHLRYVQADYYWNVKKREFDKEEAEYRSYGRTTYFGSRYRNRQGDLYTGLVLEAWVTGRITNHHAAEYMGIKNLRHMLDIRDHYGGG